MDKKELPKLNLCVITYNEEDWLPLMLESILDAVDNVIFVDSGSSDNTIKVGSDMCKKFNKPYTWLNFNRENLPSDDGKQRNVYLDYLKKQHLNEWVLVLDSDEIAKGNMRIGFESLCDQLKTIDIKCIHIKMRHLIGDFGHEDATIPEHWTACRMFKVEPHIYYPETEHNILQGYTKEQMGHLTGFTVFHYAHVRKSAFYWRQKNIIMREKSNIHTPEQQEWWYHGHLFGTYPRKPLDPSEHPQVIKDKFFIPYERKPTKILISVATVPGNTGKVMECIKSIEEHTHGDHEVLLTNNNWVGFAAAHNKALKKVLVDDDIEGVVIINDDCRVKRFDWLDRLKSQIGIVGCTTTKREYRYKDLVVKYCAMFCVYIPSYIIKDVGLLDERFRIGDFEDVDYCHRSALKGYNCYATDVELVEHDVSHTVGDVKDWRETERSKNKDRFLDKWGLK